MSNTLVCDVSGCHQPALVRVFPTHGTTDDSALRCRECLLFDLRRDWFEEWASDIETESSGGDGR